MEITVAAPGQIWRPFVGISKLQLGCYEELVDKIGTAEITPRRALGS